jgi:Zn-dependent oligopeptidase
MTNPLMQPWAGVHGLPPFADIEPGHFKPAFEAALTQHRAEIDAIAQQAELPTFANTVAAFDATGRQLTRLEHLFYTLAASATSPALQAVQRDMAAPLAEHGSAVYMHQVCSRASRRCSCSATRSGSALRSAVCWSACTWTSCVPARGSRPTPGPATPRS